MAKLMRNAEYFLPFIFLINIALTFEAEDSKPEIKKLDIMNLTEIFYETENYKFEDDLQKVIITKLFILIIKIFP